MDEEVKRFRFILMLFGVCGARLPALPVTEWEPHPKVYVSEELLKGDFSGKALKKIIKEAGAEFISLDLPGLWVRDSMPLFYEQAGVLKGLGFRNAKNIAAKISGVSLQMRDLDFEAGNIVMDGGRCFLSEPWIDFEHELSAQEKKQQELYMNELKQALQVPGLCSNVHFFKAAAHPHIDMWAKVVAPGVALVNQLEMATFQAAGYAEKTIPPSLRALKQKLDEHAQELSQYVKVIRVPMPFPFRGIFRTYTNSFLINGHALVPQYSRLAYRRGEYPDRALIAQYESRVRAIYEALGFKTHFISADNLIHAGGAFHCALAGFGRARES